MNNVHLSNQAQDDLEGIKKYIAEELENPAAALAVVKKIINAIRVLRQHALVGAPLYSIAEVDSDYRFLVSENYLVFYRSYGNEVYIDRVLYGRRDYLRILFGDTLETEIIE